MRRSLVTFGLALVAILVASGPASADLPRTYQVQALNSPNPTIGGDYGIALVNVGDVDGGGEQDFLVGTDEHGGSVGQVYVIAGEDGSTIRTIDAPETGGTGTLESFGSYVGGIGDVGSCSNATVGQICADATVGAGDGVPDMLVAALGVDVPFTDPDPPNNPVTLVDAGRAYIVDGDTGAILKRAQMPTSDLDLQLDAPGGAKKPAFGRTVLSPSSQYGPTGGSAPPASVQAGDVDGDEVPDFIVGASDFFETGSTASPDSDCASSPANECQQAGRAYVFSGAIAGTDPDAILDTPLYTVKNPAAQADDLDTPVNSNRESMGYSVEPVGDLGECTIDPNGDAALGGDICTAANSTATLDGRPEIALSSHRTDDFGMFDVGVVHLLDGTSGAVLYTYRHPEPQPASIFGFTNYNQPAPGDLGSSTAPDVYQPAMRQNNPYTGGGRGYVLNGSFKQGGSPNSISFATLNDPTPNPSEDFGTSSAGIGDVAGDPRNELLIGAYGPHNPGTNPDVINDVHIVDPRQEIDLQTIPAPDQQPGAGFGTSLAPLGDLNDDGFLDFVVGAGLYDLVTSSGLCSTGCADAGRIYIFRSDDSAPPAGPPAAEAGRALEIEAPARVRRRRAFRIAGLLEAFANEAQCVPGQRVLIQRRRPGRFRYARIRTVTTNGFGRFSARVRARRTFVYRARVGATAACNGAVSNPQKVVVRKRRRR